MVKKIVIIGPESTGKSELSNNLAKHFNTIWCPEYAREYLLTHGTDYDFESLATIAKGQIALEEQSITIAQRNASLLPGLNYPLFIDTDMYVMKVWCDYVFNRCHQFIIDEIGRRQYHGYLLCNTDLPWVKDELREYPDLATRQELFGIYQQILQSQPTPWFLISGRGEERLHQAIDAVGKILETPP